jgi:hypothetical protein
MKLRIDNATYERVGYVAEAVGISRTEVVRRCLRRWSRCGRSRRVVRAFMTRTATRRDSEAYEMDLGGFAAGLTGREVLAVVRWRLACLDWGPVDEALAARREYERAAESVGCVVTTEG